MKRDYTQLPSLAELKQILATEAVRKVPAENATYHFVSFDPIIKLINHFGLSPEVFQKEFQLEDLRESDIQDIETLIANLVHKLNSSDKSKIKSLADGVYDYLSEEDSLEHSDLIFVFGSASNFRIDKAIEIYKKGYSNKIMVSGRGPYYSQDTVTEAEKLASYAIERGVSESDIIKETRSITLPDNVKSSLNVLDEIGFNAKSIMLVNSPFAQRRGWAHFKKFGNYKLLRINSDISEKYQRDHWFEQEKTIEVFVNEFVKMKIAIILNTV